jgi:hypothetical protein
MEYAINGIIAFSRESGLKLSSQVDFISASKASISLSSKDADKLSVLMKLQADDDTTAEELAQLELNRICNLLSFYNNIGVSYSRVGGMSHIVTSKGQVSASLRERIHLGDSVSVVLTLGDTALTTLATHMKQEYSPDFEEVLGIWREAISNESLALRYLLLYRLFEFLFESDTKALTSWIINKDPNVQLVNDRRRGEITIYTSLRDHIHPKEKIFPIKDIQGNVGKLQILVHQRITEKYTTQ